MAAPRAATEPMHIRNRRHPLPPTENPYIPSESRPSEVEEKKEALTPEPAEEKKEAPILYFGGPSLQDIRDGEAKLQARAVRKAHTKLKLEARRP